MTMNIGLELLEREEGANGNVENDLDTTQRRAMELLTVLNRLVSGPSRSELSTVQAKQAEETLVQLCSFSKHERSKRIVAQAFSKLSTSVLRKYHEFPGTLQAAFDLVWSLSYKDQKSQVVFAEAGLCLHLVQCAMSNIKCVPLVKSAFGSLSSLCRCPANQNMANKARVFELVFDILKEPHNHDVILVQYALDTVASVIHNHRENQSIFTKLDGLARLVKLTTMYQHYPAVVRSTCILFAILRKQLMGIDYRGAFVGVLPDIFKSIELHKTNWEAVHIPCALLSQLVRDDLGIVAATIAGGFIRILLDILEANSQQQVAIDTCCSVLKECCRAYLEPEDQHLPRRQQDQLGQGGEGTEESPALGSLPSLLVASCNSWCGLQKVLRHTLGDLRGLKVSPYRATLEVFNSFCKITKARGIRCVLEKQHLNTIVEFISQNDGSDSMPCYMNVVREILQSDTMVGLRVSMDVWCSCFVNPELVRDVMILLNAVRTLNYDAQILHAWNSCKVENPEAILHGCLQLLRFREERARYTATFQPFSGDLVEVHTVFSLLCVTLLSRVSGERNFRGMCFLRQESWSDAIQLALGNVQGLLTHITEATSDDESAHRDDVYHCLFVLCQFVLVSLHRERKLALRSFVAGRGVALLLELQELLSNAGQQRSPWVHRLKYIASETVRLVSDEPRPDSLQQPEPIVLEREFAFLVNNPEAPCSMDQVEGNFENAQPRAGGNLHGDDQRENEARRSISYHDAPDDASDSSDADGSDNDDDDQEALGSNTGVGDDVQLSLESNGRSKSVEALGGNSGTREIAGLRSGCAPYRPGIHKSQSATARFVASLPALILDLDESNHEDYSHEPSSTTSYSRLVECSRYREKALVYDWIYSQGNGHGRANPSVPPAVPYAMHSNRPVQGSPETSFLLEGPQQKSCGTAGHHLSFESRFESANLLRAIQIGPREYDLVIRSDLHTSSHHQWFYFAITNTHAPGETGLVSYRFNVVNLCKPTSLFSKGIKPCLYSFSKAKERGIGWRRCGSHLSYTPNEYVVPGSRSRTYFTLSFTMGFGAPNDTYLIAMCYPYTYSKLQEFLKEECDTRPNICKRSLLCTTLGGLRCDELTITNFNSLEQHKKQAVVFTARVHPGETNASYMMEGTIRFLLGDSGLASILRELYVFKIVPMLNPDGVYHGNYRTSLSGQDLNRAWANPKPTVFPTIWHTKNMIRDLQATSRVALYVDFHGHSRKENVFMYGVEYKKSSSCKDLGDWKLNPVRAFPRLVSESLYTSHIFSLSDCSFSVSRSHMGTARVVVARELGVRASFTLEASFGGCGVGPLDDRMQSKHLNTLHYGSIAKGLADGLLRLYHPNVYDRLQQECVLLPGKCIVSAPIALDNVNKVLGRAAPGEVSVEKHGNSPKYSKPPKRKPSFGTAAKKGCGSGFPSLLPGGLSALAPLKGGGELPLATRLERCPFSLRRPRTSSERISLNKMTLADIKAPLKANRVENSSLPRSSLRAKRSGHGKGAAISFSEFCTKSERTRLSKSSPDILAWLPSEVERASSNGSGTPGNAPGQRLRKSKDRGSKSSLSKSTKTHLVFW